MNTQEAQRVLAVLCAAWPRESMTEATARVWIDHLRDIDVDAGTEAATLIVNQDQWFPPIARFRSTAQGIMRRRQERRPGLPSAELPLDAQQGLANVRKVKAMLAGVTKKVEG